MEKRTSKNSYQLDNFNSTANLTANKGFESTISLGPNDPVNEKDDLYEPFDHREVAHPNSDVGSLAHLLKSSLGSGILAMPTAFKNAGLLFGSIGTVIIGIICTHCVHILVKTSHEVCKTAKVPSLGFAETCGEAFRYGPQPLRKFADPVRIFVDWALVATYVGAACVYVVLMATSFHEVFDYYYKDSNWDLRIYCALFLIPLIFLGQIRNLKYLVPFSAFANVFLLATMGITMYYIFQEIPPADDKPLFTTFAQLPLFISTVIFAMEGIGVVMPVENDMANPGHFLGCPGVLNIAMGTVLVLYTIIGLFGYLRFGDGVLGSVTSNLPEEEISAQIAKILIGLAILFTYGLQFYVPMDIIFKKLEPKLQEKYHNIAHISIRAILVTFTVAIAVVVPKLDLLISLVGAIFFSTLGLLIPAVVESVHCWNGRLGRGYWKLWKNILIGLLSIIALVSGTYTSIKEMIEGD